MGKILRQKKREREWGKGTNKEIKRWTITYKFWRIVFVITFELGKNIPSCSRELWFKSATIDEIHFSSEIKKVRTLPFFLNFSPSISFLFSLSLSLFSGNLFDDYSEINGWKRSRNRCIAFFFFRGIVILRNERVKVVEITVIVSLHRIPFLKIVLLRRKNLEILKWIFNVTSVYN